MRWYPKPEEEWERWFAWYPVPFRVDGDWGHVWWEWVERRHERMPDHVGGWWYVTHYRLPEESTNND